MKPARRVPVPLALVLSALVAWSASSCSRDGARSGGRPEYGAWGFDLAGRDTTVRPGDDFFRYANGGWADRTEIPADRPATSLRLRMTEHVEDRLREILEREAARAGHRPADIRGKVGAFYRAFMDTARIESLGVRPLAPLFAAIRGAATRDSLAALAGQAGFDFYGSPFGIGLDVDFKDPSRYAVYLGQAGLGLPDRDYYLVPDFAAKKDAYAAYVAKLLSLAGWPDAHARARDVVAYESAIAAASWDRTHQRDPVATYNPVRTAALDSLAPGFAWSRFLAAAGLDGHARVVVAEASAFPKIAEVWARTPVPVLQAWFAFTVLDDAAPYLASPWAQAAFELRGRALSGQQAPAARWKRGVRAVGGGDYLAGDRFDRFGNMGWAVGRLYTERWFPPAAKAQIETLVVNLCAAYRSRLERLDWMSPETRAKALRKLDTYQVKVGYPEYKRDYVSLVVRDDDLVGDVRRAADWEWRYQCARLDGPVDRADWGMTPQTNDAYNGSLRDIVFPAGILQAPIFDPAADPAVNYGAVGAVIGHELTHGFDDQGRKIDADGRLADWWTAADDAEFRARAARLGAQYDRHEPLPGVHVNGALTMGENIADLGGVVLALEAYRASRHGRPAPVLDGFTGDQRVFLGWAQAWRGKSREEALRRQVVSDPHSPRMFRVNGPVQNVDDWYTAFGVRPGAALYLAPEDRVRIW